MFQREMNCSAYNFLLYSLLKYETWLWLFYTTKTYWFPSISTIIWNLMVVLTQRGWHIKIIHLLEHSHERLQSTYSQTKKKKTQKCVLHPFFNINLANICTLLCVIFHVFDNVYGYIKVSLIQVWSICWQVMLNATCRMQNFCQIKSLRYSHNPWQSVLILYVHSSHLVT